MSRAHSQLQCPNCGGGLSYTALYPRGWAYEAFFPDLKIPLVRICSAIVLAGVITALVHPALTLATVLGIGVWTFYRYFAALQCDQCRNFYIRGQFDSRSPRVPGDTSRIIRYFMIAAAVIAVLAGTVLYFHHWFESTCSGNCIKEGLVMDEKSRPFQCNCSSTNP